MNTAMILAGGLGKRIGGSIPKQFIEVKGQMIIVRCILNVLKCDAVDGLHIVADEKYRDSIKKALVKAGVSEDLIKGFSDPGKKRQFSIRNALIDMKGYMTPRDIVIIHDAARPNVSKKLISKCIEECKIYDGVIPMLPMKDTVYLSNDGMSVTRVVDKDRLFFGQSPEAFKFLKYLKANEALSNEEMLHTHGAAEPAVNAGLNICMINGEISNFKITTEEDLQRYIELIKKQQGAGIFTSLPFIKGKE